MDSDPCHLGRLEFITKMGLTLACQLLNQTKQIKHSLIQEQIYGVRKYLLNAVNITRTHPLAAPHTKILTLTKAHIISLVIHYTLEDISNKIIVCRLVRKIIIFLNQMTRVLY